MKPVSKTTRTTRVSKQKEIAPTSLEAEATAFVESKTSSVQVTSNDSTLLALYSGSALSGLLSMNTHSRPVEVVNEAFEYGKLMLRRHKEEV